MKEAKRRANLVLSGGGVKGIAYAGMFEAAEETGFSFNNIAGVSAGALFGALKGAGYTSAEMKKMLDEFEFSKVKPEDIQKKVPAVQRFIEYQDTRRSYEDTYRQFLYNGNSRLINYRSNFGLKELFPGYRLRGNFFKNIIDFCKDGCLFDGDFIEEWVYRELMKKGVRTFADLRQKEVSYSNPFGYSVRMTAVDLNRGRLVVLPDDIEYYGIEPDKMEVARAVRMSISVPFAFKPVEINRNVKGEIKKHYLVDGGVLDNFPLWLGYSPGYLPLIGVRLERESKKKLLDPLAPLNVLKGLIGAVHDFGIPKFNYKYTHIISINTGGVTYLDFDLSDSDKKMLVESGWNSGQKAFKKIMQMERPGRYGISIFLRRILGLEG
ncbi:MAG: patatin-like phospholipase family protein [Clostridiaceae bacterium]|nr:patatin-like phospholipase family protein [Clostridiaceae bacterium]